MVRSCKRCGQEFRTFPSKVKSGRGKYCSSACYGAAQRGKRTYKRTPEHRAAMSAKLKGRITNPDAIIAAANARRGVPPSELTRQKSRERWTGEGNPNWKDGRSYDRYAPGFFGRRLRDAVIARDQVCIDCGEWDDRPRCMHVHHLDGGTANHDLSNIVLLCIRCHRKRHRERRTVRAA